MIFTDGGFKTSVTLVFMTSYDYYVQVINAIIFISFITYALQCPGQSVLDVLSTGFPRKLLPRDQNPDRVFWVKFLKITEENFPQNQRLGLQIGREIFQTCDDIPYNVDLHSLQGKCPKSRGQIQIRHLNYGMYRAWPPLQLHSGQTLSQIQSLPS